MTPMAAMTVTRLPEGEEWLYEIKWDGYRALVIKDGARVEIRSRNDKDLTSLYPTLAAATARVKANRLVMDGEVVALDPQGRPSFQALQHLGTHADHQIAYYAFDVLHLEGQ